MGSNTQSSTQSQSEQIRNTLIDKLNYYDHPQYNIQIQSENIQYTNICKHCHSDKHKDPVYESEQEKKQKSDLMDYLQEQPELLKMHTAFRYFNITSIKLIKGGQYQTCFIDCTLQNQKGQLFDWFFLFDVDSLKIWFKPQNNLKMGYHFIMPDIRRYDMVIIDEFCQANEFLTVECLLEKALLTYHLMKQKRQSQMTKTIQHKPKDSHGRRKPYNSGIINKTDYQNPISEEFYKEVKDYLYERKRQKILDDISFKLIKRFRQMKEKIKIKEQLGTGLKTIVKKEIDVVHQTIQKKQQNENLVTDSQMFDVFSPNNNSLVSTNISSDLGQDNYPSMIVIDNDQDDPLDQRCDIVNTQQQSQQFELIVQNKATNKSKAKASKNSKDELSKNTKKPETHNRDLVVMEQDSNSKKKTEKKPKQKIKA